MLHRDPTTFPAALRDAAEQLDEVDLEEAEKTAAAGVELAQAVGFDAAPLPVRENRKTWRTVLGAVALVIAAGAESRSWSTSTPSRSLPAFWRPPWVALDSSMEMVGAPPRG